ncbi:hypothetical protein LX16_0298 [Stackebrandtia albiflava]|uniref:Uncharacterized protein n=1 Tax=Stackebrandtia albiflava TaxID=406432 RepID=A0A562V9S8_9ACTN|nr:hypothetical protein [Stackebrandtia albiflava]TWJ14613.1 hypothetical protein LX16_0298 [Stackebrandtia albiflava]
MTGMWPVRDDTERLQWSFTPYVGVGPVRFGMTSTRIREVVGDVLTPRRRHGGDASVELWDERPPPATGVPRTRPATAVMTTYHDDSGRTAAIAVDARNRPQVTLDGLALVGRVPSVLEDRFIDRLSATGADLRYSLQGHPWSSRLGLLLRVQRAGDHVLTRPVMACEAWAERFGDSHEGPLPEVEWRTFEC